MNAAAARRLSPAVVVVRRGDARRSTRPPPPSSRRGPRIPTLIGLGDDDFLDDDDEPTVVRLLPDPDRWFGDPELIDWDAAPYVAAPPSGQATAGWSRAVTRDLAAAARAFFAARS